MNSSFKHHINIEQDKITPTYLSFQYDGSLTNLPTKVLAAIPASSLDEADKPLFKQTADTDYVLVTEKTIFHPQGGGQPSDIGSIKSVTSDLTFDVILARTSIAYPGIVLHLGQFNSEGECFAKNESVEQSIDTDKRLLYSKYHTAGHVLGSAVRHLLEKEVEGFDELKASHFPDSASCEFAGLIAGSYKEAIQKKVEEFLEKDMPVEFGWWDENDFKEHGLERLTPDAKLLTAGETKFRIVNIVGAEVYPCGGTHVQSTKQCGKTTVKKISRQKGMSKVSYSVQ